MSSFNSLARLVGMTAIIAAVHVVDVAAQSTSGTIAGRVMTPAGEPATDAEIRATPLSRRARVDAEGAFVFEDVPSGTYLLEVISPRPGHATERIVVEAGARAEVVITVRDPIRLEQIMVSAGGPARRSEMFQAASVVTRDELAIGAENSLGETLSGEPGVTSTYFGPGASRPVIRGLGGDRVRLLENGVGVGDASSTSPDHAVSIDPSSAERIEILRGPATLLYGGSAIGGVVNVLDERIARERPTRSLSGDVQAFGNTVADAFDGAARLNLARGPAVLHLSGTRRSTDDYAIPGFADLEIEQGAEPPGDARAGTLENSALDVTRGAVGLSLVGSTGYLGASFLGLDTDYGVPGGHAEEEAAPGAGAEGEGEESIAIDLEQRRVDVEGGLRFTNPFFQGVRAWFGSTNYEHRELEGDEVGTVFLNDLWETRVEAEHGVGDLTGTFGAQLSRREFSAIGEEAFVPPTETNKWAVFAVEELELGRVGLQLGARYERQNAEADTRGLDLTHDGVSASGGIRVAANDAVTLALSVSRSVKLPNAEELFSDGPHAATLSFEVGDAALREEDAIGVDASIRVRTGPVSGEVTGFVTRFDDFIHQVFTDEVEDGLPVFPYTQADALFTGFELQGSVDVLDRGDHSLALDAFTDYVRAELTDTDRPLPRIPALRLGGGFQYQGGPFGARFGVRRVTEQDRVATFEEPTPGYTMVDASVTYRAFTRGLTHEITIRGTNLADQDARNHVSFLKGVAPLPGRDIRLMYRLVF